MGTKTPFSLGIISSHPISKETFSVRFMRPEADCRLFSENIPDFWYDAKPVSDVPYQIPFVPGYTMEEEKSASGSFSKTGYQPSLWKSGSEIVDDAAEEGEHL